MPQVARASSYKKKIAVAASAAAVISVPFALDAAAVSSGNVDHGVVTLNNGQGINACARAQVEAGADFKSFAVPMLAQGKCATPSAVPAGYLGAWFIAFQNGSVCGYVPARYSTKAGTEYGIGGSVCGNPPGLQNFQTNAYSEFYRGPSYPYNNGYVTFVTQSPIGSF